MGTLNFSSLALSEKILTVLAELKFEKMTPIQAQSLPLLLEGQDLIGQSKTGSGKTAAFSLPILQKMNIDTRAIQALILCPTRELSTQVARDIRKFGRRYDGLQVLVASGGIPVRTQIESLINGVHIVVGTPGRILDLMDRERFDLSHLKILVMDEADKMLDMGFEDEIKALMKNVPAQRQTLFFSATFPETIQKLSQIYQNKPVRITVEEESESVSQIEQITYEYKDEDKASILMRILQQHSAQSTLIFCNQKITVDELVNKISGQGVSCAALHGDLEQRDRDRVMAMFRNGSYNILVATDVAARGLDIDHLDLVINYDFPNTPDTYIHRIGRTGRAGRKGVAVTLVKPFDGLKILELEKLTKNTFLKPTLGFKNQHGLGQIFRETVMQTLAISGGRKDKLRPGDILGALTGEAGLKSAEVGKIEIHDRFSYVAVSSRVANLAFSKLRDGRIKGHKFQVKLIKT